MKCFKQLSVRSKQFSKLCPLQLYQMIQMIWSFLLLKGKILHLKKWKKTYKSGKDWKKYNMFYDLSLKWWTKEHLSIIQAGQKESGFKTNQNLKVNNISVMVAGTAHRNSWLLGCVTPTFPECKSLIPSVLVKMKIKVLPIPIDKLRTALVLHLCHWQIHSASVSVYTNHHTL